MFILNAPTAQKSSVTLRLYKQGQGGKAYKALKMKKLGDERWEATVKGDLKESSIPLILARVKHQVHLPKQ